MNKKYTYLWVAWVLAFIVIEGLAIANKRAGDTLSEHIWKLIGTPDGKARTTAQWTARIGLGAGLVWLIVHFFTKGL